MIWNRRAPLAFMLGAIALAACERPKKAPVETPSAASGSATPSLPPVPTMSRAESEKATAQAKGSNAFAFDLWGRLRSAPGNLAVSPGSISAALAMTYGGAAGATAAQMKTTMHFDDAPDAVMTSWGGLSRSLTDPGRPMKLRLANRLFGEKTTPFEASYLDQTRSAFGAGLEPTDFKTAFEPSRGRINAWVEQQTAQRIKDLLPMGSLTADTRLVLVNAIYFIADWETQFDKAETHDEPFHVDGATTTSVPTMKQTEHLRVATGRGARMLELPYAGGSASMLVVLPDRIDGLAEVEQGLSSAVLESWTRGLATVNVRVELPRFEVSPLKAFALGKELVALGMGDAFERTKADFTKISNPADPRDRLFIGEVFHKAFVRADEKGTEAGAATAVVMARAGGPPAKPVEFRVDRPFLFFIVDKASGLVLFMGRVANPKT